MSINRIRVAWSGDIVVGPGLTTFYFTGGPSGVPSGVKGFFSGLATRFPTGLNWTIPDDGDVIDEASGQLTGTWSTSGEGGTVNATAAGAYAAGVGARIAWQTGVIRGGRRVRGSTFLVPIPTAGYDAQGTIAAAYLDAFRAAADALITVPGVFQIWSRPRPGLIGAAVPISSALVPDRVSWLRSRRT